MQGAAQGYSQSGNDGSFRVTGLVEGVYRVSITHNTHSDTTLENIPAKTTDLEIVLRGPGTVTGRVVRAGGQTPVTDFMIYHYNREFQSWMGANFRPMSDAEGKFTLNQVKEGASTIHVRAEGHADGYAYVADVREGETLSGVVIELTPGGQLDGLVVDTAGTPVYGALVFIGGVPQYNQGSGAQTQTGRDGAFQLDTLPEGQVVIGVSHAQYAPQDITVDARAGARQQVEITLSHGGSAEGRVTLSGQPQGGKYVSINYPGNQLNRNTQTDAEGQYQLQGLPNGTANISVSVGGPGRYRSKNLAAEIADGSITVVDFHFAAATGIIKGVILDEDGNPLQARVSARIETADGGAENASAQSDANGSYQLQNLPAGSVLLSLYAQGHSPRSAPVELGEGQTLRHDFNLGEGQKLVCRVSNIPAGAEAVQVVAVPGQIDTASATLSDFMSWLRNGASFAQAIDGVARLEGLEPGPYTVCAIANPAGMGDPYPNQRLADVTPIASAQVTVPESGPEITVELRF